METGEKPPMVALLEMTTGGWVMGAVAAAAELGLADHLKDVARSAEEVATGIGGGASASGIYRLMRFLASSGVLREVEGGRFGLTEVGEFLRSDGPGGKGGSMRAVAIMFGRQYNTRAWEEAAYSVRTEKPAFDHVFGMDTWKYFAQDARANREFNDAMTALASTMHAAAVEAYDFGGIGVLCDVGGGHGRLLGTVLAAYPGMRGMLFDQPHVIEGAAEVWREMGVAARASAVAGDFFEGVPAGADAYMMSHILHDWDDERSAAILRNVRRASKPGGRLLVLDAVVKGPNEPDFGKLLDLQMMVIVGGRERTAEEFAALMRGSGFEMRRVVPTESSVSVVEGVAV